MTAHPSQCPEECQQDRKRLARDIDVLQEKSMPSWVRTMIISAIGLLFTMFFAATMKSYDVFQTKEAAKAEKAQTDTLLAEIRSDVKTLLVRKQP